MINSISSLSYSQTEILNLIILHGYQSGGSFALWRKPKSDFLEFVFNNSELPEKKSINLEDLDPGFVVHPFADQKDKKAFYISANNYGSVPLKNRINEADIPSWIKTDIEGLEKESKNLSGLFRKTVPKHTDLGIEKGGDKSHFKDLVTKGISAIKSGKIEKVVPARTLSVPLSDEFDVAESLFSMLAAYPDSFVNFFHIPKIGSWIGASPEILIETKGDNFYTMSLAGTQPASGDNPLKTAAWTQKEIEEQALVSRYIVDCFKKIRLREYEEYGPKTVLAGTLLHLRSVFKVNMEATKFPQLGSVMLELLHPTSAVCGMPREEAHDFLQKYEALNRSFFAGFIGPVNIKNESSIYVNLRTASLYEDRAILYAGAGVTEDSDPEKEWEETELKCQIIGKFLQNQKD